MNGDPYLDLEHGVLRNLPGLTDRAALAQVEAGVSAIRLAELEEHDLPGRYDLDHLQAFHRRVFGDIYDWAGELRTVSIGKGMPFCLPQHLRSSGETLFVQLARRRYLEGLDRAAFVDNLAGFLGELNALHPFREGNGRTQRAFCGQLARAAGHPIRWALLDGAENITASKAAHLGDLDPLRRMLDRLVRL
ncbi:MAG: Fic family protein [Pseudonocardia sp.]|nr:Fic family protein [Pseudonocardia sp.]